MRNSQLVKRSSSSEVAKGWFLTYPKCPLEKSDLLKLLQASDPPIVEWVVARELHADGTPHLHAFVKYASKVTFSAHRWDLLTSEKTYHGNYQAARSWNAVQDYCKKGGDFIASFDTAAATNKRAARNQHLIEGDLKELVDSGFIPLQSLRAIQQARNAYTQLGKPEHAPQHRGIWIYGPSGAGKSHYVRYKEDNLFIKAQNKWWDGYRGEDAVLLDDFDQQGACLFHYLKIWADKWACSGEVKGDTIGLRYKRFYVTSNFRIQDLFKDQDPETIKAIRRRFHVIKMLGRDLGLDSRPDSN